MQLAKVTGVAELRAQAPFLEGQRVITVEAEGQTLAAVDMVGARAGDRVLLLTGASAGRCYMASPADAVAVAVLKA